MMKRKKVERISVCLLIAIILMACVELIETGWFANAINNNQNQGFNWNLNRNQWSTFAYFNEQKDSVQLVIGLNLENDYVKIKSLIALNGGEIIRNVSAAKEILAIVAEIPFASIRSVIEKVESTSLAKYIEPNFKVELASVPNDPYWSWQWGPQKIEADWAWNITIGTHDILVAVVDTGIDYTHEDLEANYVPLGYDWVNNDTDPLDDHGHGTFVAGIIAAEINNCLGIAGLAQVRIMAEKTITKWGTAYADWAASGILHATDQGAKIISMSFVIAGVEASLLHEAVKHAYNADVLLIAAAGNDASNDKRYPAAFDEVVAVTATKLDDNPASFTNYGDWVELAAPGVSIYSTMPTYNVTMNESYNMKLNYDYASGTSFACPHVSGVAALVWSQFPNATRDWVRTRLRDTADDLGEPGFDEYYGYGRINARKAVGNETLPVINYTLTITTTVGGTTNPPPGNYTYSQGQNVLIQAIPNTGYGLNYWELNGTNVGSANPYSILMDSNHTLHAVFVPTYTLTITTTAGGTTSPSPGSYIYNTGTSVLVTATPYTYYSFDHWKLDGVNVGSANSYAVLMDTNHTLHAVFIQIDYTLIITATDGGTTSPMPGVYTFPAGLNISVTAIPDTDYVLNYWKLNDINIGATNPIGIIMDGNNTLQSVFRIGLHDVAITNVTPSKTIVGQGYSLNIKVTIANQGDYPETFNVTVYVNTTEIGTPEITLSSGTSTIITLGWNTTGLTKASYSISAYIKPVLGETYIEDNTLVAPSVIHVVMPGDADLDKVITILDVVKVTNKYGAKRGDQNYDPNVDWNDNGTIDILDVVIVTSRYAQKDP